MEMKDIIQRIGIFRNKYNLSAWELSLRINKHDGYINKLESKDFNLPKSVLLEIIDAIGVTPEEFFSKNYQTYEIDYKLLKTLQKLPVDKRKNLIDFIED